MASRPLPDQLDPRFLAAVQLIERTGARDFQIRYSDDEQPVVWIALAGYPRNGRVVHQVGAGMDPVKAVFALCDTLIDGGQCTHCHRPTGFVPELGSMPLAEHVCWYQWDPELKTFRRGCE